jgi:transcriptional regulator with XRE-family HTH domain
MKPEEFRQHFGQRVRYYRQHRGWLLDDLALRIETTRASMSRIETGKQNLTLDDITAIARALEVPISQLFDCEDAVSDEYISMARQSASRCLKKGQQAAAALEALLSDLKLLATH